MPTGKIFPDSSQQKTTRQLWISVVLVLLWLTISFGVFSGKVFAYTRNAGVDQLREVSAQTSALIHQKLTSDIETIVSLSFIVSSTFDDLHSPEALALVESLAARSTFDRIRLTTPDGRSYAAPGNMIEISDRAYFKDAMSGNSGVSDTMLSLFNDSIVFVVYAPIYRDGQIIGTIHGACEVEHLSNTINISSFGGLGYSHIFQQDGSIVLESVNAGDVQAQYGNLWHFFDQLKPTSGFQPAAFQQAVQNGDSGLITYIQDGTERVGYYSPVGLNHLYLLQVLPTSVISASTAPIKRLALMLVVANIALFLLLLPWIIYLERKAQRNILLANREMMISNEQFRIAISHTASNIFEYDLTDRHIAFPSELPPPFGLPKEFDNGADYLAEQKVFDPESLDDLALVFGAIDGGEPSASVVLKSTRPDGCVWSRVTLTTIFDERDKPVRAIGTIENVTTLILAEQRYAQEEQYHQAMLMNAVRIYEIDITSDKFALLDSPSDKNWSPYTSQIAQMCKQRVLEVDHAAFMEIADRGHLMQAFAQGIFELYCEYRLLLPDGGSRWHSSTTHLLREPQANHVKAFTYVRDINEQKLVELALREQAERDPLTKLYNRAAVEKLVSAVLHDSSPNSLHTLLSIDLDGFKEVNDRYGHMEGDAVLQKVADQIQEMVRTNDVVARMGGDEFIVFLRDARSLQQSEVIASRLCERIRSLPIQLDSAVRISASIGIATTKDGNTFSDLYRNSDLALYYAKRQGKDRYAVYFPGLIV